MTDDEAFVRAIVDRPTDDLPRLVYADWLDEHGDPRGAYLRAEVEWARQWAPPVTKAGRWVMPTRLRQLAGGIDAVWLARVSRPPVGVCCDRVRFRQCGPPASEDALDHLGRRARVDWPADYRAFLVNWNGGRPVPDTIDGLVGGIDDEASVIVTRFRPVLASDPAKGEPQGVNVVEWRTPHHTVRRYAVVADLWADGTDALLLALSGDEAGAVYYHRGRPEHRFNPMGAADVCRGWSTLLTRLVDDQFEDRYGGELDDELYY